jgi:hypothetical protein
LETETKQVTAGFVELPVQRDAVTSVAPRSKKPYVTPVLKRLGSVRELTLGGGSIPIGDGRKPTEKGH